MADDRIGRENLVVVGSVIRSIEVYDGSCIGPSEKAGVYLYEFFEPQYVNVPDLCKRTSLMTSR